MSFILIGCVHKPLQLEATKSQEFVSHPDWVGLTLPHAPFAVLKKELEARISMPLKDRNEAHITVLTPPEFNSFDGELTMADIETEIKTELAKARWTPLCVGTGQLKTDPRQKTYFVVVDSEDLIRIRRQIQILARTKGLGENFNASRYHPHITLGFTERDLHEQDGVIKDKSSCVYDLKSEAY